MKSDGYVSSRQLVQSHRHCCHRVPKILQERSRLIRWIKVPRDGSDLVACTHPESRMDSFFRYDTLDLDAWSFSKDPLRNDWNPVFIFGSNR